MFDQKFIEVSREFVLELQQQGKFKQAFEFLQLLNDERFNKEKKVLAILLKDDPITKKSQLEVDVDRLMAWNQPLKAWDLVKNTDSPLKKKVWNKVRHAFDPSEYKKFYEEGIDEYPVPEEFIFKCELLYPRFAWVVPEIEKKRPAMVLDIGCAEGYLCLTLAKRGIPCVGINLHKSSVDRADEYVKKAGLTNVQFLHQDFFDHEGEYPVVVFFEILEHLPNPRKGIEKAYSLVAPGGSLYISTPKEDHIGILANLSELDRKSWDEDDNPAGHLRLFTIAELKNLLSGYNIKQFYLDEHSQMLVEVGKP